MRFACSPPRDKAAFLSARPVLYWDTQICTGGSNMAMLTWEALEQACKHCQKCALADTRHNVVFGVGPRDAEVMLIGEGPGENEDLQGEPFVGPPEH